MAYGVRWKVEFAALNDDRFRIEILQENWDEGVVNLIGAEDPITTKEDDQNDIFTTVRTQNGVLKILDNGFDADGEPFDYTEMIPESDKDMQVKLWQVGGNGVDVLRWIGYIRPDSLTSRMYEDVSVREFQLACPLSVVYNTPFTFSNTSTDTGTIMTIGNILHHALASSGVEFENVYKCNVVEHREDLICKVSLLNFVGGVVPTHTTPPSSDVDNFSSTWEDESHSWGDIIDSICKFFGWTIYGRALDLFIVSQSDRDNWTRFAFDDLLSESNYVLSNNVNIDPIYVEDLDYVSTNHTECRTLGYREIKIEADVNANEDVLNPDFSQLEMEYYGVACNPQQIIHINNENQYVVRRIISNGNITFTRFIGDCQIYEHRQLQTLGAELPYVLAYYDKWKADGNVNEFSNKTSFSWTSGVCCYKGGQNRRVNFFVKTLGDVCFPAGATMCISAEVSSNLFPDGVSVDGKYIPVKLRIGNLYWDGSGWSTDQNAYFNLIARADGSVVFPQNTYTNQGFNPKGILFDEPEGSNGYCINNTGQQGLTGRLQLSICSATGDPTERVLRLVVNKISVSIYTPDSKLKPVNKQTQVYTDVATTTFKRNLSVNLDMASGAHNKYGIGQLYTSTFSPLETLPYRRGGLSDIPEHNLLRRMVNVYNSTAIQNTIEIADNVDADSPLPTYYKGEYTFYMMNCSHHWRDGKMTLTMINK